MKKIVLLALFSGIVSTAMSSHLRCGYITAKPVDCSSRDYLITITVYTDIDSDVKFGGDGTLNFGDGTTNLIVPETATIPRPDLGANIGIAQFSVRHIFSNLGTFLISYKEPNRNGGVLNMNDSFFTEFYVETSIVIGTEFGCTASPEFLTPAILQAAAGTDFTYSMGVSSEEDNLITYEMVVPFRDRNLPVSGYVAPANLAINYLTGLLTWDTNFGESSQSIPGEYNFAIQASQHIKIGETYRKVGFIRIDFQVIVSSDIPDPVVIQEKLELDEYNRLLVSAGQEKKIKVFFESTESSTLQAFSELAESEAFTFESYDSTHEEKTFKVGLLTINPDAALVRENPYLISFRAQSPIVGMPLGSDVNYLLYTEEIPDLPVIDIITGVEGGHDAIDIYPNPSHDKLYVRLHQTGRSVLVLYTAQGQRVKSQSFQKETELSLSDLPPGIYYCEIRKNNSVIRNVKVIKH